jgi:hypothetical protein
MNLFTQPFVPQTVRKQVGPFGAKPRPLFAGASEIRADRAHSIGVAMAPSVRLVLSARRGPRSAGRSRRPRFLFGSLQLAASQQN